MKNAMSSILELEIVAANCGPDCDNCDCADPETGSENCGCEDFQVEGYSECCTGFLAGAVTLYNER